MGGSNREMSLNISNTEMDDRRANPRKPLVEKLVKVQQERQVLFLNVSKGGASFLSDRKCKVGSYLSFKNDQISVDVKIMECIPVGSDKVATGYKYKVRCKFDPQNWVEEEAMFDIVWPISD